MSEANLVKGRLPLGFAQFGVVLHSEGAYRFVAQRDGGFVDAVVVQARPLDHLRLGRTILLTTTGESCSQFEELSSLDGFVLHPNQSLEIFVVPADEDDQPMLGLLALSASASSFLSLSPIITRHTPRAVAARRSLPRGESATVKLISAPAPPF